MITHGELPAKEVIPVCFYTCWRADRVNTGGSAEQEVKAFQGAGNNRPCLFYTDTEDFLTCPNSFNSW